MDPQKLSNSQPETLKKNINQFRSGSLLYSHFRILYGIYEIDHCLSPWYGDDCTRNIRI